jgi:hypothetical protein
LKTVQSSTQLPARLLLLVAGLVPIVSIIALAAIPIPLGKPGTLVYPYSRFDAVRLMNIALALIPIGLLVLAVRVAAGERRGRELLSIALLVLGIAGMGIWALTSAPHWQRQNFFNMASPSHDGAFLLEADHVRQVGVGEYVRTFAARAATPPADMKGTRVISNPPAVTLIATACDALIDSTDGLRDTLAAIAVDEPGVSDDTLRYAARALLFAGVLIAMWVLSGAVLYGAARTLVPAHVAVFVAACATVTPMTVLFTPGKDAAQLLTVALPLWLWLLALKRGSGVLGVLAGAAVELACGFSLVHVWVALCVAAASTAASVRLRNAKTVLRVLSSALAGVLLAGSALWWMTGYNVIAASSAVAHAQAAVTRGEGAMPLTWQMVGVPLFLLFAGPALWFLTVAMGRGSAPSAHAIFGRALILTCVVIMLLTVGFTNIETPRLWIPFAALLTLGLTLAAPWIEGDRHAVARTLAWVVAIQGLASAYQWSKMDMRETEMRLLETPEGGARLFQ